MTDFDKTLPHPLPWNYPWIKDEIERRDEYIAQLEAELAHQKPQDGAHGAIDGESVKTPAEDESGAHSEPDSREKLEAEIEAYLMDNLCLDSFPCDLVSGWLDRQAAITRRNFRALSDDLTADNLWMHERITELQSQLEAAQGANERQDLDHIEQKRRIAELEEENDALREWKVCYERMRDERDELVKQRNRAESDAKTQRNNFEQATSARKHWQKKAQNAEAERDKLKAEHERIVQEIVDANTRQCERTNELAAERDRYRAALGKAIDCADEIRRLS